MTKYYLLFTIEQSSNFSGLSTLMRAQVQSRSRLVINVLSVGRIVRAVKEIQVKKNVGTHAETATSMIGTAETRKRNAQMSSCIGVNIHPMVITKSFTNVFDSYLYLQG